MEWISVKDRLPDDGQRCLCCQVIAYNGTGYHGLYYFHISKVSESGQRIENAFWGNDSEWGDYFMDNITHWMPLPELPKEQP